MSHDAREHTAAPTRDAARPTEFAELRRRFRSFVFPMTALFLAWYFLYVLLSTYAPDFMSTEGARQHQRRAASSACCSSSRRSSITILYVRWADRELDPRGRAPLHDRPRGGPPMSAFAVPAADRPSATPRVNITIFALFVAGHPGHRRPRASRNNTHGRRLLRRRPRRSPAPERHRHRAATTCRPHRSSASPAPSRSTATTASSTRSASWWPGWSRCCWSPSCCATPAGSPWPTCCLPAAAAPGPHGGGDLDARRQHLLPAGPDGRRRRAGRPAARRRRRAAARASSIAVVGVADDRLRARRRHEGHHLGADRQGRPADRSAPVVMTRAGCSRSSASTSPTCWAPRSTTPARPARRSSTPA